MGILGNMPAISATAPAAAKAVQQPSPFSQVMQKLGPAFQRMGEAMGQDQQPLQIPQAERQSLDPFALLSQFGINPMSNYLGRLGRY